MRRQRSCAYGLGLALSIVCMAALPSRADEVEKFYKGRTVTLLVGVSPGGGYDLYARLLSQFLPKHIPGGPTVIVQNMPGAGGLRLANYLYSAAPKDGSVFGTFSRSVPTVPLFQPSVTFDATKFTWLGSIARDTSLCITNGVSPIKTWRDLLTKPLSMGGQGVGTDSDIYARLYRSMFGAQIKLVSGYPGTRDITLAMERGEVDGTCGLSWGTIKTVHSAWVTQKSVNFLLQAGLEKDPELPDVPLASDLVDDPEKKKVMHLYFAPQAMGRPFTAPPNIPADRKAALIKAFDDTMKDREFLAAAAQQRIDVSPMKGSEIENLVRQLYATPADIIAKAAKATSE